MKRAKKVLIVYYPDGYRGCDAGKIYTLSDNFEQDMELLLTQGAWYTLDERCFKDFMDSFWNNKVKIGVVGKNTTDLSNFKAGDLMTEKGFDKDTMCDNFQICGPNCYSYYKTHAPITDVVDLTDEQKGIIERISGNKKDLIGVDKFINAFYLLLLLQNHRLNIKPMSMMDFESKTKGRDGYVVSIDKPNYYSYKERETREQELRENIRNAQKAIKYLTGCELEFDGKAKLEEAIIVNREIDNGLIKAVKTGDKRIGLNDALELSRVGVGTDMAYVFGRVFKNHTGISINYGIAYSLLYNLFEVVDHSGVMFVEKGTKDSANLGEYVDCCITIDNDISIGRTYLFWGKDATALELCGGIERYTEMIENQINKGGNND